VCEGEALSERHAEMIHELERRSAGASLLSVDYDEIRIDIRCKHRLAYRKEFPGMADAEFETCWLAAGQLPHLANEFDEFNLRREHGVAALRKLRDAGFRLFTPTDNLLEVQIRQLEHSGIRNFFEKRFSADGDAAAGDG
jgi:hypothetical protein